MDDKGQMIVLEAIFFAMTIIMSLVFIYQLSPSSIVTDVYSNDLKIMGDDALRSLYNDDLSGNYPAGYPSSKLVHYLISNSYGSMVSDLNNMLPPSVMYNIYLSNETQTIFWCNSLGVYDDSLHPIDPVSISHCIVAIHPAFSEVARLLDIYAEVEGDPRFSTSSEESDVFALFDDYSGPCFEVILEMWSI